ncbi:hypothetical protein Q3G72_003101 [Acer saccharum]|nr:hypothetical protein Q3G72_003101 [Acer saccharum]
MSAIVVMQEQDQAATKWDRIVTETTAYENLGSIGKEELGNYVIAQKSNTDCKDPVSEYGPHLDSNKVSSNFNLSNSESLIRRSGSNSKRMVDKSSGVGKRKFGRGLKLGISGEKFKVCGGKRKLDLVCTGDLVKDTKIRKKNEVFMEIGIQDGIQLEFAKDGFESSSLEVINSTISTTEGGSDSSTGQSLSARRFQ